MRDEISRVTREIARLSDGIGETKIMEVCGTHTAAIAQSGLKALLPENITFVSGPGCPVCVTHSGDVSAAVSLAESGVTVFCCGDMMRVPCSAGSLSSARESGADVRLALSPLDAARAALLQPEKQFVFFAVGFETTGAHTAALIEFALNNNIKNLSVLCSHKTMPAAITSLLGSGQTRISALLCPGHVAAITGSDEFGFIPEKLHMPAVISGFEPYDILVSVLKICSLLSRGKNECVNMYPRVVTSRGNPTAKALINDYFEPCDALWRGLGSIAGSGLALRESYSFFDARKRFDIKASNEKDPPGCICSSILRGEKSPQQCANFKTFCTPGHPLGPCMVSSEGSCSAQFKYG